MRIQIDSFVPTGQKLVKILYSVHDAVVCGNSSATKLVTRALVFDEDVPNSKAATAFGYALSTCSDVRLFGTAEVYIMKRDKPWQPCKHLLSHGIRNPSTMHVITRSIVQTWRSSEHIRKRHLFYMTAYGRSVYLTRASQPGEDLNLPCDKE